MRSVEEPGPIAGDEESKWEQMSSTQIFRYSNEIMNECRGVKSSFKFDIIPFFDFLLQIINIILIGVVLPQPNLT